MNKTVIAIGVISMLGFLFARKSEATFVLPERFVWEKYNMDIPFRSEFFFASNRQDIPIEILAGVARNESNFDPNARGADGELGMMQFMPSTAKDMGIENPFDPRQAIEGAAKYLKWLNTQVGGNWRETLISYNWGIGNVLNKGADNAPNSSKRYAQSILEFAGLA